ncbi:helix-turn-helix domain-containing protein [Spiractinospora alimapuensis]|nr:helix-turn-helix domain-containing protein [Spiractinospora alimapuensis]
MPWRTKLGGVTLLGPYKTEDERAVPGAVGHIPPRRSLVVVQWCHSGTVSTEPTSDDLETIRAETAKRFERAMGELSTAAVALMEERLSWFRGMDAEDRSWVGLIAQSGVAAFVDWFKNPGRTRPPITAEVYGMAPRELTRSVTLQHTVEMIRIVIDVAETRVPELAAPGGEAQLREGILRYSRELAFSTAKVYARAAEARGAWDARLEALVVDALLHGDREEGLETWSAALGWKRSPVIALAGQLSEADTSVVDEIRGLARNQGHDVIAGVQGDRLIVVLGINRGQRDDDTMAAEHAFTAAAELAELYTSGPVVVGAATPDLRSASASVRAAVSGLRAAPAWPHAPRPVGAEELLPERALDGDDAAREQLYTDVYQPLQRASSPLLDTLAVYLEHGGSLEAAARTLFVHSNTVRYRLGRVAELTGRTPTNGRGAFALRVAVALGRLRERDNGN